MKKPMFVVARLAMVAVAVVPALAQDGEFDVVPAEEPVPACGWTSSTGASDPSDHAQRDFRISQARQCPPSSKIATLSNNLIIRELSAQSPRRADLLAERRTLARAKVHGEMPNQCPLRGLVT